MSTINQADPLTTPYTIVVDTREQRPFAFANIFADAVDGRRPLNVQTVRSTLSSGDYSLAGYESLIAVERKSAADLFNTLGQGRRRFTAELARLGGEGSTYQFAAVVVEAEWRELIESPPPHSKLRTKTVHRSVIAWQQQYPRIAWWFVPGRAMAEVTTLRVLERFWKTKKKEENRKRMASQ